MSSSKSILSALAAGLIKILGSVLTPREPAAPRGSGGSRPSLRVPRSDAGSRRESAESQDAEAGRARGSETTRIDPDRIDTVDISYAPDRDGAPDAGEVIWTWVPYEENDGRGKDRPVLVIGRQSSSRVYAVRMTSKPHDGDRDYLSIGSGAWDSQGRESWVDIEQLYSVHEQGMRREAAALDKQRFGRVAKALSGRYGWSARG